MIVDGLHNMLLEGVREAEPGLAGPPLELALGVSFKSTLTDKIYHVAWMGDLSAWLVSADSRYGLFVPYDCTMLRYTKPSTAKAGAPGNNAKGWKVGDKVIAVRQYRYEIIATGDKCVLLMGDSGPFAVPNDDLETHYKKAAYDSGLFD